MSKTLRHVRRATVLVAVFSTGLFAAAPESPVADAAQARDLGAVRALLQDGADVNAAQGDGMTALHWAAMQGDVDIARVLLYAGANPEAMTRLGAHRPLHLAARYGQSDLVTVLLEGGGEATATTGTGVTPLHFAAGAGLAGSVQELVSHGADVNATEWANGQTPLMFASAGDRLEAVAALLAAGADVSIRSSVVDYGRRAEEDGAARRRRQELVTAIRKADAEARGEAEAEGESVIATRTETPPGQDPTPQEEAARSAAEPPAEAAREGREAAQAGAASEAEDVELGVDPRRAAREEAAEAEDPPEEEAGETEDGEAEPAPSDTPSAPPQQPLSYAQLVGRQGGMTALHYAVRDGHDATARSLLGAGADIDRPTDGDRSTPLILAAINGHYDLALWLLEQGADVTVASEDGVTPLYAVIANRWAPKALYPQPTAFKQQEASYLDLMEAMLEAGADPDARVDTHIWYASFNFDLLGVDFMGATPFWRAAYALDVPAMELLAARGASPEIPTMKPPERRFGRRSADEDEADPSGLPPVEAGGPGIPPLVAAAGVGYGRARAGNSHRHAPDSWIAAAKYLVEVAGADVNARDHDGFGALHYAAARGDNELIEYLVGKGADPTIVARTGQTTVDMANGPIQRVQPFPETIALLEGMGAKNNDNCVSC